MDTEEENMDLGGFLLTNKIWWNNELKKKRGFSKSMEEGNMDLGGFLLPNKIWWNNELKKKERI